MKETVFISYSHCDDFVTELKTRLKKAGIESVWRDKDNIINGSDWARAIEEALKNAALVILVISPAAMKSAYVTYEWRRAKFELYKELYFIYLEQCDDTDGVFGRLQKLQLPTKPLSSPVSSREWDSEVQEIKRRLELIPIIDEVGQRLISMPDREPRHQAAQELGSFDKFPSRARDWLHKGIERVLSGHLDGTDLVEIAHALSKVGDVSSFQYLGLGCAKQKDYQSARDAVAETFEVLARKSNG